MKAFLKTRWIEVCCVVTIVFIHGWLLAGTYRGDHIDATTAGQFGDFVGGYIGTIFLVISVALLAASYRHQKAINKETLDEQIKSNKRTAFESRFFELLKYHRENVSEIGIGEKSGRRVFVSLIREFRATLAVVDVACEDTKSKYSQKDKIDLAYMAFYYGVGPNSTRVFTDAVKNHPQALMSHVVARLETLQRECRTLKFKGPEVIVESHSSAAMLLFPSVLLERISYVPFDGHQSRLGHYYRHLYQTVKYTINHAPTGKAAEYVDIIRAQLTNHEQALLCINSLSTIGSAWIRRGYLTDYSMIKNIPKGFFEPAKEIDLKAQFPSIHFEFEDSEDMSTEANRDR